MQKQVIVKHPHLDERTTFEIARMMGASMRKRGYSGWAKP